MADSPFNFFQQWYPVAPVEDIPRDRPIPITLLNRRFVIWVPPGEPSSESKESSTYRAFLDQCPHRFAPLSEGRIDDKTGHLMCSYHGWQFQSDGTCTSIPQADDPALLTKNPQLYCATPLPTREGNGLLWLWPDAASAEQAASQPLPLSEKLDASQGYVWSSMVRDLEYDWQTLVENIADPAHVQFAHHGVQGNRDRARSIPMEVVESTAHRIDINIDRAPKTRITFTPPCHLEYAISFGEEKQIGLITYCIPVAPGKSRIVAQFSRNFAQQMHKITPRWWEHLRMRHPVLDGDMVLLHYQEKRLQDLQAEALQAKALHLQSLQAQESNTGSTADATQDLSQPSTPVWKTAYRLPTQSDRLVIEFRRWIDRYCGGQLPWIGQGNGDVMGRGIQSGIRSDRGSAGNGDLLVRKRLLDRYRQHTQICSSCSQALKRIQQIQIGLLSYFVLVLCIVALLPDAQRFAMGLPLIISGLLGLGGWGWLKFWLEPQFYFVDYVHAEK